MIPSHRHSSYAGPSQERPGGPDMPANNEKSKFKLLPTITMLIVEVFNNEHWTFMKHNANQRHRNHFQNNQGNQTLCRQACSQSRGIEIDSCHDAWKHRQTLHRIFTEFTERQQLEYNWNVCNTEEKVNSTGILLKCPKKRAKELKVIIRILTRLPSTQRTARPSVPVWFKCE